MKSFTDIEQSKKLAEILPIESADMFYTSLNRDYPWIWIDKHLMEVDDIPCWSLAALLGVIPKRIDEFNVLRMDIDDNDFAIWYDEMGGKTNFGVNSKLPDITMTSPIDACVEMIVKLKENNLL